MNDDIEDQNDQKIPILHPTELKFISPVGRGAKGVVFRVQIGSSGEELALKMVSVSNLKRDKKGEKKENREEFEQKILRELKHPLLPRLRGVMKREKSEVVGYALDYCVGKDLNTLRKQQTEKMFSDDVIRFYGAELVLALEYLHKQGIVYRDLKPENILIHSDGHLMLVDFDLSTKLPPNPPRPTSGSVNQVDPVKNRKTRFNKLHRWCNSGISPTDDTENTRSGNSFKTQEVSGKFNSYISQTRPNSFVGTEEYVAPEIILANGHDFAVDWWSLGVVLYEMLYGKTPFRGANRKETFYRILRKEPELVGETTSLRDLIRRLLEKDPDRRITVEQIKGHDFFKGVDWDLILRIERPPYIPVRREMDADIDGIKGVDLESIVQGVLFNKNGENENNNDNFLVF